MTVSLPQQNANEKLKRMYVYLEKLHPQLTHVNNLLWLLSNIQLYLGQ